MDYFDQTLRRGDPRRHPAGEILPAAAAATAENSAAGARAARHAGGDSLEEDEDQMMRNFYYSEWFDVLCLVHYDIPKRIPTPAD